LNSESTRVREFLFDDKLVSLEFVHEILQRSSTSIRAHAFGIWILRAKVIDVAIGFRGLWRVLEKLGMREYRPAGASKQSRYAIITRAEFQAR